MKTLASVSAIALIGLAGCASTPGETAKNDPYEGFNRRMFAFNDTLDRNILEPAAKGYRAITTEPIRDGVSNALANVREPVTFANELLQGEFVRASDTVSRFVINSTIGVVGFVDVAGSFGMKRTKEDFGQTLAVWGMDSGPYLVLPIVNSTTPRDLFGSGVDVAFQPFTWTQFEGDSELRIARSIVGTVSARQKVLELVADVREQQVDPYTALRRNYVQMRDTAVRNGQEDPNAYEDLPDYDEY